MVKKKVEKKTKVTKAVRAAGRKASSAKFVSFSFGATIPTQSFGNVTPRIEVVAASYEDARDFAIPKINELYAHFAEIKPTYLSKITETVKVVTPSPKAEEAPASSSSVAAPASSQESTATPAKPKSDAVLKAEKAIGLAMTKDATIAIEEQIQKSVKIAPEDKPLLYELVLKRRKALK